MKNGLIALILVVGIISARNALSAPLACSKGGTNVWGENVRTGKAIDSNLSKAQEDAYSSFVNNLASLGKECIEDSHGYLEFGPIQSFSGKQSSDYWATWVVSLACCVP